MGDQNYRLVVVGVVVGDQNYRLVVVAVVADVDIPGRIYMLLLLLLLLWRFVRTHKSTDVLCTIWCILGTIRCH